MTAPSVESANDMRRWRRVRLAAGSIFLAAGLVLLFWPLTESGSSCGGGSLPITVGIAEPRDGDRFVPASPGADYGNSLSVECDGAAFPLVALGLILAIGGSVILLLHRRIGRPSGPKSEALN